MAPHVIRSGLLEALKKAPRQTSGGFCCWRGSFAELEEQLFSQEEYRKHMAEVKASLEAAVRDASTGMITTEFVAQDIDKIFVSIMACGTAKFDSRFSRVKIRKNGSGN